MRRPSKIEENLEDTLIAVVSGRPEVEPEPPPRSRRSFGPTMVNQGDWAPKSHFN